jgi:hypothetical protein
MRNGSLTRSVLLLASLPVVACRGGPPPADGPAPAEVKLPFSSMQAATIGPGEGEIEVDCPWDAAFVMALAAGGGDLGGARPVLRFAGGCVEGERAGDVAVRVGVELEWTRPGEPEAVFDGISASVCAGCGREGLRLLLACGRGVREAIDRAATQWKLASAPESAVTAFIEQAAGTPREILLAALDEAGNRRIAAAAKPAARLLSASDPDLALRALGALGRIGETSVVRELGRVALSPAPDLPHAALRAIADIGGAEASRTLDFVATQSPDPVIVREARDLIEELEGGKDE